MNSCRHSTNIYPHSLCAGLCSAYWWYRGRKLKRKTKNPRIPKSQEPQKQRPRVDSLEKMKLCWGIWKGLVNIHNYFFKDTFQMGRNTVLMMQESSKYDIDLLIFIVPIKYSMKKITLPPTPRFYFQMKRVKLKISGEWEATATTVFSDVAQMPGPFSSEWAPAHCAGDSPEWQSAFRLWHGGRECGWAIWPLRPPLLPAGLSYRGHSRDVPSEGFHQGFNSLWSSS